jgi:hypothetical protein
MERKSRLAVAITAILTGVVLNSVFDEQTPACILAMPTKTAAVPACPVQLAALLHDEPAALRTPSIGWMSGQSHGVSAAFGALSAILPPRQQTSDSISYETAVGVFPNLVLTGACPDKTALPLHLEQKDVPLRFIDSAVPPYVSNSPQFYEDIQPQVWAPGQRSSLVVILTPPAGELSNGKEAKPAALEPPENPHYEQQTRLFEEASFLPGEDAWGHFDDDGEEDEPSELYAA